MKTNQIRWKDYCPSQPRIWSALDIIKKQVNREDEANHQYRTSEQNEIPYELRNVKIIKLPKKVGMGTLLTSLHCMFRYIAP